MKAVSSTKRHSKDYLVDDVEVDHVHLLHQPVDQLAHALLAPAAVGKAERRVAVFLDQIAQPDSITRACT